MAGRIGGWTLLVMLTLSACGGRERGYSVSAGGGVTSFEGSNAGSAGDSQTQDEAGAAGEKNQSYASLIASGTRSCENEEYCFGLACYAPGSFYPNICLARCESDADCRPNEECVRAPRMSPTCFARCKAPVDCYQGFDCYNFSRTDLDLICFPGGWAVRRDELGYSE